MPQFSIMLKAGVPARQQTAGRALLILSTGAASSVGLTLNDGTQELESIRTASRGLRAEVAAPGLRGFTSFDLLSAVDCTVEVVVSRGAVGLSSADGSQVLATVTNTSLAVVPDRGAPGNPVYVSGLTYSDAPATAVSGSAPVAVTPAGVAVVAANAARKGLRLRNLGPDPVAVGGTGLTWANRCIVLDVGDMWVEERGANVAWSAIVDAGKAASLGVQEVVA
jgi:hypothetical protein